MMTLSENTIMYNDIYEEDLKEEGHLSKYFSVY